MSHPLDAPDRQAWATCLLALSLSLSSAAMADVQSKRIIGVEQNLPSSIDAPVGIPFSSTILVEARDGSFIPWDTRVPIPAQSRFKVKTYVPCEGQLSIFSVDSQGETSKPALMARSVEGEREALSGLMGLEGGDDDERIRVELMPLPKQPSVLSNDSSATGPKCTKAWHSDLHFKVDDGEAPTPKWLLTPLISPILGGVSQLIFDWASHRLAQWWRQGEQSESGYALVELQPEQRWRPAMAASTTILGEPDIPVYPKPANGLIDWTDTVNHQGAQVALVLLNDQLHERETKPLGSQLKPGEKFKIRLTATFNALATIERQVELANRSSRPVFPPQTGQAMKLKAGRSVDIPIGDQIYLTAGSELAKGGLVLTLKHAMATPISASDQPVYRTNSRTHSTLLQLTPAGQRPVIVQRVIAEPDHTQSAF